MPRGEHVEEQEYRDAYSKLIEAATDRFMWGDSGGRLAERALKPCAQEPYSKKWTIDIERDYWPYIRVQDNDCDFCRHVIRVARDPGNRPMQQGGFRLKNQKFYSDAWREKPVWIQLLGRNDVRAVLRLFVGDERPELPVRALEPQTTFGTFA